MGCNLASSKMTVESGFEIFEEAGELVQVEVETRHILDEEVTEVILVH
jgi:hypothetical protein